MADGRYLHIKVNDYEFEAEGTEAFVLREKKDFLDKMLSSHKYRVLDSADTTHALGSDKMLVESTMSYAANAQPDVVGSDPLTALCTVKHMTEAEFIMAATFLAERRSGQKYFTSSAIRQLYLDARRNIPKNINVPLLRLARRGLIMDAPKGEQLDMKTYTLTSSGIDFVNQLLSTSK